MDSFDSDGVRIAYIDVPPASGQGDAILLIHGFASNHAVNWVNTQWVRALSQAGYRTVALDNRGHGESEKLYDPEAYSSEAMASDAVRLLDHLGIECAHVMGYSMGARITAHIALDHAARVRSALIGGLGMHLVEGRGLPSGIAEALEAPPAPPPRTPRRRPSAPSPSRPAAICGRSRPACAAPGRPSAGANWRRSRCRCSSLSAPSIPWRGPAQPWRP
ncbi:alpha/beta fold hydrolase [Methylobacterium persicinum]